MKYRKYGLLVLIIGALAASSLVCTTSYITPAILTQTAEAGFALDEPIPTAQFLYPTNTPSASSLATPEPGEPGAQITPVMVEVGPQTPTEPGFNINAPPIRYYSQSGDTLSAIAIRFGVQLNEITTNQQISETGLIDPGTVMTIPQRFVLTSPEDRIIPDSEVVYSATALNFDLYAYTDVFDGHLVDYKEYLGSTGWTKGPEVLMRVAEENSINPRLLLALLEYQGGWVLGEPANLAKAEYPIGHIDLDYDGLYDQLAWAVNQLSIGYYGWREGTVTSLTFANGSTLRLSPTLNAGTVGLYYLFSKLYNQDTWYQVISSDGFMGLYETMFGSPYERSSKVEPLLSSGLEQPYLILPFMKGQRWAYTGGPHGAWEKQGSQAAIDFAPTSIESGCVDSNHWVVASAAGVVVRSGHGVVVLDLDGDGLEQTGWSLLYLHLTDNGLTPVGAWVEQGDFLGHPSCEGGISTGTHVHIARKYNGEWIAADGPVPYVLSGWVTHRGAEPYQGTLTRGDEVVNANLYGSAEALIMRTDEDPE